MAGGSNTLTQSAQPAAVVTYNAGSGSNTLNVNGGVFTFTSDPRPGSGNLTVNDYTSVVFSAPVTGYTPMNLSALNVLGSATAMVTASAISSARTVLETSVLSIASGAKLDLANNALIIHGGDVSAITALIEAGYSNGVGIYSSSAATDPTRLTTLGVMSNNNSGTAYTSSFDNQMVAATDVLIKETYYGDTNLDGVVDGSDYSRIDSGYLNGAVGWFNGDFNYDNVINGSDYTLIDNAFNRQGATLAAVVAKPSTVAASRPTAIFSTTAIAASENDIDQKRKHRVIDLVTA